jgi:hypothetical protein
MAMHRSSKRLITFVVFSFGLTFTLPSVAMPYREGTTDALQTGSLCANTERIIFSCTVKRPAKIVSLCASKRLTSKQGYLQYRFGLPGKVELEFPNQRGNSLKAFQYDHYFRAQFDLTQISFSSGGYKYVVFDDYNGEQKPARTDQGVRVTAPNNGNEVTLDCRGRAKVDFGDLSEVFGTEP